MQTFLEHHLPPCLSHITVEYMSGTREHWANVFTSAVLNQLAMKVVVSFGLRILDNRSRARLNRPRNVHDRRDRVMCEVDGRTTTDCFMIPSCRHLRFDQTYYSGLFQVESHGIQLLLSEPTLGASLVWAQFQQWIDPHMLDGLLTEPEYFSTWSRPLWAVNNGDEQGVHQGWSVKVRGEARWLPALKNTVCALKSEWKSTQH